MLLLVFGRVRALRRHGRPCYNRGDYLAERAMRFENYHLYRLGIWLAVACRRGWGI